MTTTLTVSPRLLWLIVDRVNNIDLRRRQRRGGWRLVCPVDDSHDLTMSYKNITFGSGLAVTCHGVRGNDSPGHSIAHHLRARHDDEPDDRGYDLHQIPCPCEWCGCPEAKVLQAFHARSRDKFSQDTADGYCKCGGPAYQVGSRPLVCLRHLCDEVGLHPDVIFGRK